MPIALVFQADGFTQEHYDVAIEALGHDAPDYEVPDGLIAHLAGPTERGFRVIDVWESQEAADAFYGSDSFQSMLADMPVAVEPEPWPLHRLEAEKTVRHVS
jgi:hypothetical protein